MENQDQDLTSGDEGKKIELGEVKKYPQNETKEGKIVDIDVTTKGQFFQAKGAEVKFGDDDDRIMVVNYESHDGFKGEDFYNYPKKQQLTNKHNLGKFKQRYGDPQIGKSINIDFDDDGNPSIII